MMNPQVRFEIADAGDDPAIRRMLRENPMRGNISLTFEREPSSFAGTGAAGSEDLTIVAREQGTIICMGRSTLRECWVNGAATPTTYLSELRLDQTAQGRFRVLRDGYSFFQSHSRADLHFTSIAADNSRALRFLESGRRGMPGYQFLGGLTTLLIEVPRRSSPPTVQLQPAKNDSIPRIAKALNEYGRGKQLATVWNPERLISLERHGLPIHRWFHIENQGNDLGCVALWDQRSFRQTVIKQYSGWLAAGRPLVNMVNRIRGSSMLPNPGTVLAHGMASPLALADGSGDRMGEVMHALFPMAAQMGLDWLTVALPSGDPEIARLRKRFRTRSWESRLYLVQWPEKVPAPEFPSGSVFLPEVALL